MLDYGNQPDHKDLDRNLIRGLLAELSKSECHPAGGTGSRAERMATLRSRCDSQLEKRWLDLLDDLMLRPPSDAQYLIEACSTKPDFYYGEENVAIYIDGPPHDDPEQMREDVAISQRLMEMGYIVIRFHHKADWEEKFRHHPDVFGAAVHPRPLEADLAVVTLLFVKAEPARFTQTDRDRCRQEGEAALRSVVERVECPPGVRLEIRFAGDGISSHWLEVTVVAVGVVVENHGDYRTKLVILDIYDRMQRAFAAGQSYATLLNPPPADPQVAHPEQQGGR